MCKEDPSRYNPGSMPAQGLPPSPCPPSPLQRCSASPSDPQAPPLPLPALTAAKVLSLSLRSSTSRASTAKLGGGRRRPCAGLREDSRAWEGGEGGRRGVEISTSQSGAASGGIRFATAVTDDLRVPQHTTRQYIPAPGSTSERRALAHTRPACVRRAACRAAAVAAGSPIPPHPRPRLLLLLLPLLLLLRPLPPLPRLRPSSTPTRAPRCAAPP